jgi:hypothetical protein
MLPGRQQAKAQSSKLNNQNLMRFKFFKKPQAKYKTGNNAGHIRSELMSNQVKLLITNNAFCIVQRATALSKTGIFRDYGVAEAPPGFQAGWSDCMYFSLFFSLHFSCSSAVLV